MRDAAFYRSKARGYLAQADRCGDAVLADELRSLARQYFEQADRVTRSQVQAAGLGLESQ